MKKSKKIVFSRVLTTVLSVLLLFTFLVGCTASTQKPQEKETEEEKTVSDDKTEQVVQKEERIKVKFFGERYIPEQKTEIIRMLEDRLNVEFVLMGAYDTEINEKLNVLLLSNDMPDVLYVGNNSEVREKGLARFTEAELKEYMPNYYKTITEVAQKNGGRNISDILKRFEAEDGKLSAFPHVWSGGPYPQGIIWRKDILDQLGKEVPKTIEEWEDVFAAYKKANPDKYPWAGCGKLLWQSFTPILDAVGMQFWHYNVRDGKIVQGYAQPEFKQALATLQKWYKEGYIHPEWPAWDQPTKYNYFYNGNSIVTEWISFSHWDLDEPYLEDTHIDKLTKLNPDAKLVLGPYPRYDENKKPALYVWDPFTGNFSGFGKHLQNDTDKLHRVMKMLDTISYDEETLLLAYFGIEGTHWEWDKETKLPKRLPGAITQEEHNQLGIGYYWTSICYSSLVDKYNAHPRKEAARQKYSLEPGAIYSDDVVYRNINPVFGTIRDADGENIWKQYPDLNKAGEYFTKIICDELPVDAWDEWVEYWNNNGGREIEAAATEQYLNK
ncbi:MAG: hypothetical protein GYA02_04485 [Clostridiaceae bacterium]|nr:hypothetical protein [Clostridiaceae bacterium]